MKESVALKLWNSLIAPSASLQSMYYCTLCIFKARSEYFIYVSWHPDSVVPPNEEARFFKSVGIVQSRPWNLKFVHISSISWKCVNRRICFLYRKQFAFEEKSIILTVGTKFTLAAPENKIWIRPWSFQLLSCSPSTTGLALRFTLVCHNSDDLFKAFIV